MKVYILQWHMNYEGFTLAGIVTDTSDAFKWKQEQKDKTKLGELDGHVS